MSRGGLGYNSGAPSEQANDYWEDNAEFVPKPQQQQPAQQFEYHYNPNPNANPHHSRPSSSHNPHHQPQHHQSHHQQQHHQQQQHHRQPREREREREREHRPYRQPPKHYSAATLASPYSENDEDYVASLMLPNIPPPNFPGGMNNRNDRDRGDRGDRGDRDRDNRGGGYSRDNRDNRGGDRDNRDYSRDNRGGGGTRDNRDNRSYDRDRGRKRGIDGEWEDEPTGESEPPSYSTSPTNYSTSPSRPSFNPTSPSSNNYSEEAHLPISRSSKDSSVASDFAKKIMEKSGWKEGTGLGKAGQGIVEPIASSDKIDKRGLGYEGKLNNFTPQTHQIDMDEFFPHEQAPEWIQYKGFYESKYDWSKGMKIEPADTNPELGLFCDIGWVDKLFQTKSKLDGLDERTFLNARRLANPYESIGKGIFQNRAAMKMANLDQMFQLTSADPENTDPQKIDHINFADVCAGPGGFTEYVMWRKEGGGRRFQHAGAHGFGFTLAGKDDWKLEKFSHDAPTTNFKVDYGVDGKGDVLNSDNIKHFANVVKQATGGKMLHMMMADGGISVEGDENNQETKLKQLVMCQFLMMFNILGKGGKFVCKLFDCFTPFTVGLLYLLYRHFEKICVIKPYTSRPANSERYVVCFNLLETRPPVTDYLFDVNAILNNQQKTVTVTHVVDYNDMDEEFVDYITKSNTDLVEVQINALERLFKYVEDSGLMSINQADVKRRCMDLWDVPLYRAAREGQNVHPRRNQQPISYREAAPEMKTIKQQERDLLNKHKHNVYSSSDWKRRREEPKADLRESQDGAGLLEGFLKHTTVPRQSLPPPPVRDDQLAYREKLRETAGAKRPVAATAPSATTPSKLGAESAPKRQRTEPTHESAPVKEEREPAPERRVRRPQQPSAPAASAEPHVNLKRNPGRLKSSEDSKPEPVLNFSDPKLLAALQKHKAATPVAKPK